MAPNPIPTAFIAPRDCEYFLFRIPFKIRERAVR